MEIATGSRTRGWSVPPTLGKLACPVNGADWRNIGLANESRENNLIPLSQLVEIKRRMDKKAKKRVEILRKRQDKLRQQLAGAKSQMDDPSEVENIEKEIADVQAEIDKLKSS